MHVVWKRPDGFHSAAPSDYVVVPVDEHIRVWLHKQDKKNFPFRVSGGWQDEDSTTKLNQLVNLLPEDPQHWQVHVQRLFAHSDRTDPRGFLQDMYSWLDELRRKPKGDTWEVEIIRTILDEVRRRIELVSLHPGKDPVVCATP